MRNAKCTQDCPFIYKSPVSPSSTFHCPGFQASLHLMMVTQETQKRRHFWNILKVIQNVSGPLQKIKINLKRVSLKWKWNQLKKSISPSLSLWQPFQTPTLRFISSLAIEASLLFGVLKLISSLFLASPTFSDSTNARKINFGKQLRPVTTHPSTKLFRLWQCINDGKSSPL